ncbi:Uncharacterized protein APZ42_016981 [Daphnia magna]|uniref:Uncharacterized protein n=1 Tax=Daphnia magna TaxID=35525 RepID=A0A165A9G6_9CRUS|nr:Uncharacterized protein APZ42_016981 [Daphnia magna]
MSSETVISEHAHQLLLPCWQWALVSLAICTTCLVFSAEEGSTKLPTTQNAVTVDTPTSAHVCFLSFCLSSLSLLMSIYLHRSPFNRWLLPVLVYVVLLG